MSCSLRDFALQIAPGQLVTAVNAVACAGRDKILSTLLANGASPRIGKLTSVS